MLVRKSPVLLLLFAMVASARPACGGEPETHAAARKGFFATLRERLDLDPRTGFLGMHEWRFVDEKTAAGQLERSGCPHLTAPWAVCQNQRRYDGYYVGGGAATGGDERVYDREGTWGWDYTPWWSRVRLKWFHGRRFQAGEGQYNPDVRTDPLDDFRNP